MASDNCNRVTVKFRDRTFTGHYSIDSGKVTVSCGEEQETAQIGNLPPQLKARMLLRELAMKEELVIKDELGAKDELAVKEKETSE